MQFQDPPIVKNLRDKYAEAGEALRERRGEWALIDGSARTRSLAGNVTKGSIKAFQPGGTFEAVSRANGDGTFSIYVRYIGGESE